MRFLLKIIISLSYFFPHRKRFFCFVCWSQSNEWEGMNRSASTQPASAQPASAQPALNESTAIKSTYIKSAAIESIYCNWIQKNESDSIESAAIKSVENKHHATFDTYRDILGWIFSREIDDNPFYVSCGKASVEMKNLSFHIIYQRRVASWYS